MAQKRAAFTEAEVRRALKAARREGFRRVELTATLEGLKIVAVQEPADPAEPAEDHVARLD